MLVSEIILTMKNGAAKIKLAGKESYLGVKPLQSRLGEKTEKPEALSMMRR
jgi:hypothetical protein